MAKFDGSSWPFPYTLGIRTNAPLVTVDDVLRLGNRKIRLRASTRVDGQTYRGELIYYGNFKYSRDKITGIINREDVFLDGGGSFRSSGFRLNFSDLSNKSPWAIERQLLRGNDTIIGSNFNDRINGREGNDVISGRGGVNRLTGGPGKDTFVLSRKGLQIITDFNLKEDRIRLPGPARNYDRYEWYRRSGNSFIARDGEVLGEFLGGPNLGKATYV
jgi:hypothetical protein